MSSFSYNAEVGLLDWDEVTGSNRAGYGDTDEHEFRMLVYGSHTERDNQEYDEVEEGQYNRWHANSYFTDEPRGKCFSATSVGVKYRFWPSDPNCTTLNEGYPNGESAGDSYSASISVGAGLGAGIPLGPGASLGFSFTSSHETLDESYNQTGLAWDLSGASDIPSGPDYVGSDDNVDTEQGVWFNTVANCNPGETPTINGECEYQYSVAPLKCGYTTVLSTDTVNIQTDYTTI